MKLLHVIQYKVIKWLKVRWAKDVLKDEVSFKSTLEKELKHKHILLNHELEKN